MLPCFLAPPARTTWGQVVPNIRSLPIVMTLPNSFLLSLLRHLQPGSELPVPVCSKGPVSIGRRVACALEQVADCVGRHDRRTKGISKRGQRQQTMIQITSNSNLSIAFAQVVNPIFATIEVIWRANFAKTRSTSWGVISPRGCAASFRNCILEMSLCLS